MHTKTKLCINRSVLFLVSFITILILGIFAVSNVTLNQPKSISSRASKSKQIIISPTPPALPSNVDLVSIAHQIVTSHDNTNFAPIFSLLFHTNPQQIVNISQYGSNISQEQREIITQVLDANSFQSYKNIGSNPTVFFGLSQCADSRCVQPSVLFAQNGETIRVVQSTALGAQPSLFPEKTAGSFFISHVTDCTSTNGCGALAGIDALIKDDYDKLRHHHVPDDTIQVLKDLINTGATPNAEEWAKLGARIQADLNGHPVIAVVSGHADESFTVLGVAMPNNGGVITPISEYPQLEELSNYPQLEELSNYFINPTKPLDVALASGQYPKVIAMNFSKSFGTDQLYGTLQSKAGTVFKVGPLNLRNAALTVREIDAIAANSGYGLTALKNSKVAIITADTLDDLNLIRSRLAIRSATNGIDTFLEDGGVIVSALIDSKSGKIGRYVILETGKGSFALDKIFLKYLSTKTYQITRNVTSIIISSADRFLMSSSVKRITQDARFIKINKAIYKILDSSAFKFLGRAIGTIADVYTLVDLTDKWMALNGVDYGPEITKPPIYIENNSCKELSTCSFAISRLYLAHEHSVAFQAYMSYGPGFHNEKEPWSKMDSHEVGKMVTVDFPQNYSSTIPFFNNIDWRHHFILRTSDVLSINDNETIKAEFHYDDEYDINKNSDKTKYRHQINFRASEYKIDAPFMLISPSGFIVSDVDGSELYTLSYYDKIKTGVNDVNNFVVWRVATKTDTGDITFTAIGKVAIDNNNNVTEKPFVWAD